jgi:thioredoxin reductase (NADPH)
LFIAIGHVPNTTGLLQAGIELDEEGYVITKNHVYCNFPGVFACGDVADKIYRQVATAVGSGCMAALAAERWLAGRAKL